MTLAEARIEASKCWMKLEVWMTDKGYLWARGEGADFITAKDPTSDHKVPGLHGLALAQDYVLYRLHEDTGELEYLTSGEEYKDASIFWKSLHPFCRAGYDFGDGNHMSFSDHSIPGCTAPNGQLRM